MRLRGSVLPIGLLLLTSAGCASGPPRLRVSDNHRFLVPENGLRPWFWLADTAWYLPKLTDEEISLYLDDRAHKGFNAVQIALQYHNDYRYRGASPYIEDDTDRPNPIFWSHLDDLLTAAARRGFQVAMTVMWAEDYQAMFKGDQQKARRLGKWLGERYRERRNIVWIVSGEYDDTRGWSTDVYNAMARGLEEGHRGNHLMTIHGANFSSSQYFHDQAWLSFNMIQSGHTVDAEAEGREENHARITGDYSRTPAKPVLDGEPVYEGIPDAYFVRRKSPGRPIADDAVRRKAYWSVFAGSFGHTYGNANVEILYQPGDKSYGTATRPWKEALDDPGARQMRHLRSLIESHFGLDRIPDQGLLLSDPGKGARHIQATRAADGRCALVYIPTGGEATVDMSKLSGNSVAASWFDPRIGTYTPIGVFPSGSTRTFDAPGPSAPGNDWVLVLATVRR